ncbi:hypothetical protein [Furfurilactobacillus curtus]|uniref:Uncharacterized protein n=1 Tax=Furfurilactobacillus curtus TaxID=1746200 RepID=A0ABQ5JNK0_9LACO
MARFKQNSGWEYWGLGIVFGALLPYLANLTSLSVFHKVLWVLLGLNGLYALAIGWQIGRKKRRVSLLLVFPFVFAAATFLFQLNAHEYAYYLAIGYLCLSYFAYGQQGGMTVTNSSKKKRDGRALEDLMANH